MSLSMRDFSRLWLICCFPASGTTSSNFLCVSLRDGVTCCSVRVCGSTRGRVHECTFYFIRTLLGIRNTSETTELWCVMGESDFVCSKVYLLFRPERAVPGTGVSLYSYRVWRNKKVCQIFAWTEEAGRYIYCGSGKIIDCALLVNSLRNYSS